MLFCNQIIISAKVFLSYLFFCAFIERLLAFSLLVSNKMMALRRITSMLEACRLSAIATNPVSVISNKIHLPPPIPVEIMHEHRYEPYATPSHHSSPEHERLLKEELVDYPPYRNRKSMPRVFVYSFSLLLSTAWISGRYHGPRLQTPNDCSSLLSSSCSP